MAHEIESMFYMGEEPWHGLGTRVDAAPTVEQAIKAAGMDWRVNAVPMMLPDGREVRPVEMDQAGKLHAGGAWRATVRETDGQILGVVGPKYEVVQNREAFGFFNEWITAGVATLHTAGSLRGGRRVWVLAQANMDPLDIVRGDAVRGFVLLSHGHDGTMAVRVGFTPVRVVCANTLALAHGHDGSKLLRVKHTAGVKQSLDMIREAMDVARADFAATAEQYRALARRAIDRRTLEAYVKSVFRRANAPAALVHSSQAGAMEDESDGARVVPRVMALLDGGLRGDRMLPAPSTGINFWRAYNAVTEYVDHEKGNDRASRLDSAWFGSGAETKRRALDLALKFAA